MGIPGRPPPLEHPFSLPPFLFFYFYFVAALFFVGPPKNLSWPEVSWSLSEEKKVRTVGDGGTLALPHPWMSSPLRICAIESADGCR